MVMGIVIEMVMGMAMVMELMVMEMVIDNSYLASLASCDLLAESASFADDSDESLDTLVMVS